MNRRMVVFLLSRILAFEALLMVPSFIVGLIYGEAATAALCFLPLIGVLLLLGLFSIKKPKNTAIYAREGFLTVAAAWVLMSLFGAIPFLLSGKFDSFWDCIFEIVSGFTTTGASILDSVEKLPHCILFWRSFSHWIGGMGVLVFILAVMPMSEERSMHLMRAEVPGPVVGKLVPRMRDTAKILYGVYTAMTVLLAILLIAGGMPVFDALCNSFGVAGTGGFGVRDSVGGLCGIAVYQSAYTDIVMAVFMLLFGLNFNLYYFILIGKARDAFKSEELRTYGIIVLSAIVLISINTYNAAVGVFDTVRNSLFQVASLISSTGYATVDFAGLWPTFAKTVLVACMFIGACAGSTGGGFKVSRVMICLKTGAAEVRHLLHPRAVQVVRLEGKPVEGALIRSTFGYLALYLAIFITSTLFLSLQSGTDFTTNFTAELACLNNIGPGLGAVGPAGNYGFYHPALKMLLSFNMLTGRLELFPMLVLFSPMAWRRN
ncbi:MAG: TrkH family potassium uptake protein [Clostridia bacterium]|nr:TrkH family potassium uptake protein [Clostridia bacterium]